MGEEGLERKLREPSVLKLIKKIGSNNSFYDELLVKIINIDSKDEKKRFLIMGEIALEKHEWSNALTAFKKANHDDDDLFAHIGNKLINQAHEEALESFSNRYVGNYFNARIAYRAINSKKIRDKKLLEAHKNILTFIKQNNLPKYSFYWYSTFFLEEIPRDDIIIDLGSEVFEDFLIENKKDPYSSASENYLDSSLKIFSTISNDSLFETQIRTILNKLLVSPRINMTNVNKVLYASHSNKSSINWDEFTLMRISKIEWEQDPVKNILNQSKPTFGKINNDLIKKLAYDTLEKGFLNQSGLQVIYSKLLFDTMTEELTTGDYLSLAQRGKFHQEYSFAVWALKKAKKFDEIEKVINEVIENRNYDDLQSILDEVCSDDSVILHNSELYQRSFFKSLNTLLEFEDYKELPKLIISPFSSFLYAEVLIPIFYQQLDKCTDYYDLDNLKYISEQISKTISANDLRKWSEKFSAKKETDLSKLLKNTAELMENSNDLVKDLFGSSKSIETEILFLLDWYFCRTELFLKEENPKLKRKHDLEREETLTDISRLVNIKNRTSLKKILDSVYLPKNNPLLIDLGLKAVELDETGIANSLLSKAKSDSAYLKAAKMLMKKNDYVSAFSYVTKLNSDKGFKLLSSALKNYILRDINTDLESTLDLLISILNNKTFYNYFEIDISSSEESGGHFSSVSSLRISSEKLLGDFSFAIKVDRYNSSLNKQYLDVESEIYSILETEGIKVPKVLKKGRIDDFYVAVLEYLPGKLLSEVNVTQEIIDQVIEATKKIHSCLSVDLVSDQIEETSEEDFYSSRIIKRLSENLGVDISQESLRSIDETLQNPELIKYKVVNTDRHPNNFTYDEKTHRLCILDFNVQRLDYSYQDAIWFIHDPLLKTELPKQKIEDLFIEKLDDQLPEEIREKLFHHLSIYRNLLMVPVRWQDTKDKTISYNHLQSAKRSASILGLKDLVNELESKLEPKYIN